MPAALLQQTLLACRDHGRTQIEPADRPGGALGDAIGDAQHHDRPMVPVGKPAGDDADDARMPAGPSRQQQRQPRPELRLDGALGGVQHAALDRLTFGIERVKLFRQLGSLVGGIGGQESGTQVGLADPPAGVDPGAEDEAELAGVADRG